MLFTTTGVMFANRENMAKAINSRAIKTESAWCQFKTKLTSPPIKTNNERAENKTGCRPKTLFICKFIFLLIDTVFIVGRLILAFSGLVIIILPPLLITGVLIFQTVRVAVFLGHTLESLWPSYLLFIVFLGGVLVLFVYICSLIGDLRVKHSVLRVIFWLLGTGLLIGGLFRGLTEGFMIYGCLGRGWGAVIGFTMFGTSITIIFILAVTYLLLALLVVVRLIRSPKGPLRGSK